jgi:IS30 family transposase
VIGLHFLTLAAGSSTLPRCPTLGTLVERSSRYIMLLHLPHGRTAEHVQFTIDTHIGVFFCDPHSPWQRGSNENSNGLLRQYFPRNADLSVYTRAALNTVARERSTPQHSSSVVPRLRTLDCPSDFRR